MAGVTAPRGGFQADFHNLRAVAIILIVGAHTLPSLEWKDQELMFTILDTICNESSVIFFFIAGYLFHHLSARFSYPSYMKNKWWNVLVPYLILSLPAVIFFSFFFPRYNAAWSNEPGWYQVIMYYITGRHLAPLWFVPTITMFYIVAPIFLFVDRKMPWVYLSLPIFLAASIYMGRDYFWGPLGKAAYLFPAYFFGMFVSHYREVVRAVARRWLWLIVLASAALFVGMVLGYFPKSTHILLKLLWSMIFLDVLVYLEKPIGSRLDYIATVSFGIFFIHAYFISAIKVGATRLLAGGVYDGTNVATLPGGLLSFLLYAGVVLALSVASIWIAQKILGARSRMLIGA